MFHAVSLETEPDSAKILAFTYHSLSEGIARVENAKTDFTAIVEEGLNREDAAIQFAIQTLEQTSIKVAPVSQLPILVERARQEMRL